MSASHATMLFQHGAWGGSEDGNCACLSDALCMTTGTEEHEGMPSAELHDYSHQWSNFTVSRPSQRGHCPALCKVIVRAHDLRPRYGFGCWPPVCRWTVMGTPSFAGAMSHNCWELWGNLFGCPALSTVGVLLHQPSVRETIPRSVSWG